MNADRVAAFRRVKRMVVKIGSSLLMGSSAQGLRVKFLGSLARQLKVLSDRGVTPLVVTSGAIAAGLHEMGWSARPKEIPRLQALAAVGQSNLMHAYETTFKRHGLKVAQLLLTWDDLSRRARYTNAKNTLAELLRNKVVPVVNENDTVAVEEIKFGENDTLAGLMAHLSESDLLVLLTDIDGLYDRDPRATDARLVTDVREWSEALETAAGGSRSAVGTGGMASKVRVAKRMFRSGLSTAILSGHARDGLLRLFAGETLGTFFHPTGKRMHARERWLAWGARPTCGVVVDDGAKRALLERKTSLLPSGVRGVKGHWELGDVIRIEDATGREIARGVSSFSSEDANRIKGLKSAQVVSTLGGDVAGELVNRDHLVLTGDL